MAVKNDTSAIKEAAQEEEAGARETKIEGQGENEAPKLPRKKIELDPPKKARVHIPPEARRQVSVSTLQISCPRGMSAQL